MVSGCRNEGGTQVLSAGVRRTIQSIREIVGNHSDADIYVALKETDMDPNETTQKLLNQDPFHEVKRKKDRRKENLGYKSFVAAEPRKNSDVTYMPLKPSNYSERNAQRGRTGQNVTTGAGSSREFRVVRDNRIFQSARANSKPAQSSTSKYEVAISSVFAKSNLTEMSGHRKPPVGDHSPQDLNTRTESKPQFTKGCTSGDTGSEHSLGENHNSVPGSASRMQPKQNDTQPHSTTSGSSVIGVYSSSSDPVHVPSFQPRSAANGGAIRREVGVVGPRRQSAENAARLSSSQSSTLHNKSGRDGHPREPSKPFNAIPRTDQAGDNVAPESFIPCLPATRSFSSNQYGSRTHQPVGHQKATQPNKEWKPKSSKKPITNGPGIIGSPAKPISPPPDTPEDVIKEPDQVQDNLSQLNHSRNPNVIIAAHIRVSDTDRCRLTFGSLGTELNDFTDSICTATVGAEDLPTEPSVSVSTSSPESSGDEPPSSKQLEIGESVPSSGSSPTSGAVTDHQLSEKKESSSQQNLDNYADVGLVQNHPSYAPESQQPDTSELPSFSGYDPRVGHDMSYFQPIIDETVRVPGLPSTQEVMTTHVTNGITASTIAMVQQQQQLAQMYPQLHVSHFANVMPYRQFLSPVYVPPMPGYSNSPAYPHPANGGSYLLMPGNSSHLTNGVKYGIQQFKHVPNGSSTMFGNFSNPTGYAINTPGGVGNAAGHDESSRLKYKESLYVPNSQAETSEIWMNPRDIPSVQSASYYNMPGQAPHPAYLASHSGHASFNAAAAAQPPNAQFPGMYHPQQTAAIGSHHLGAAIGGNVGLGVAAPAPGAQVGTYQQPQLGHLNWTGNF